MTLILNCITQHLAIQASDRRLTWLSGHSAGEIVEDDQNKAVVFCDSTSIAYTGLAKLGRNLELSTDLWISQVLQRFQSSQVEDAFEALRQEATALFAELRTRYSDALLRHAFVGVGWARFGDDAVVRPYEITVTNAQNSKGEWLQQSEPLFSTRVRPLLDGELFHLGVAGQDLDADEKKNLERIIRHCIERGLGPGAFARVLVAAVRRVARRNSAVGRRIMITTLPRAVSSSQRRRVILLTSTVGRFDIDSPMFMYYRDDTRKGSLYGPHFVCGGARATNFVLTTNIEREYRVAEPPWLERAIVMSPRIQTYNSQFDGPENIALLTRDYSFETWSLFASVGNNPPGPCIVQIPYDSALLSQIAKDNRFLILIRESADAGLLADGPWLASLRAWLLRENVHVEVVASFIAIVETWHRGEVVFELRHLFDRLELVPTPI